MWQLAGRTLDLVVRLDEALVRQRSLLGFPKSAALSQQIRELSGLGDPAAIFALARCLVSASKADRLLAAEAIDRLVTRLSPAELIYLSNNFGRYRGYVSDDWHYLKPNDVDRLSASSAHRTSILGLMTFHRSGYVRHEAVRLLDKISNGDEIPYLLIRQNDWVTQVAEAAQSAISRRLNAANLGHFLRQLPIVMHLQNLDRQDLSAVVRGVVELLILPSHADSLISVIQNSDRRTKRQLLRVAIEVSGIHRSRIVRYGLSCDDAVSRLICAERVVDCFHGNELSRTLADLERDPAMPVRRSAYNSLASRNPKSAADIWQRALVDPHRSIRELAQFRVAKMGLNAAECYRKIQGIELFPPAISGLAECGDSQDLSRIRAVLDSVKPVLRKAAIRGVARIAKAKAIPDLLRSLRDSNRSVIREAARQLRPLLSDISADSLVEVVRETHSDYVARQAIRLLFEKGKWQGMSALIQIGLGDNTELAGQARGFLDSWLKPPLCNRVFSRPTVAECREIVDRLDEIPTDTADRLFERLREDVRVRTS
jgi:HEAT repeat protein